MFYHVLLADIEHFADFMTFNNKEMVDFGKSDKVIKINGKVEKQTLIKDSVIFRSLFETELHRNENEFFSKIDQLGKKIK